MALDHAERVERLAVLDILPTLAVFERTDQAMATAYYHWFFLIQPDGLPEHAIGLDPEYWLRRLLGSIGSGGAEAFDKDAFAEYLRAFRDPAAVHAMCEDYRAGASIDLDHDRKDRAEGRTVQCPTLVLWGERSVVGRLYDDQLAIWRPFAPRAEGHAIPAAHFLPEERPDEVAEALLAFFAGR